MNIAKGLIISGLMNLLGTGANMAYNSYEAQKQRNFEMLMSNTAFQRQKQDMLSAGLSPALALGGASTPSGATADTNQNLMANTASQLIDFIKQDRQIDSMERLAEEKQRMQHMAMEYQHEYNMSPTANYNKINTNYNDVFTDLDNVKI